MDILEATVIDVKEILALQKKSYETYGARYNNYKLPPLKESAIELKKNFANQTIYKVMEDDNIIATIRAYRKNKTCYIGRLVVDTEHQRKGIGTALINEMFTQFKKAKRFDIAAGDKDFEFLSLYEKIGFKEYTKQQIDKNMWMISLEKFV